MKYYIVLFALFLICFSCKNKENVAEYAFSAPTIHLLKKDPTKFPPLTIVAPEGMILVPGGPTLIGDTEGQTWEQPQIWLEVQPFFMDISPVTVAQFRQFIKATQFKTQADSFGNAGCFDFNTKSWILLDGANWEYPLGKDKPKAADNHPVTQVSWNDATAYAKWARKRLPSEFEWEHAARNGHNDRTQYPFGNDIQVNGVYKANIWNGSFPDFNKNDDGYPYTSPVGHFGKTPLGLNDMTGNVWQWCADWRSNYADILRGITPVNPTEKVQRGGSYLCEPSWCHGYRVSGRSFTTPETSLMHVGFRCVKDISEY